MFVDIILDRPNSLYTNLETISGNIRLRLDRHEPITSIAVKLEGESNTALPLASQQLSNSYGASSKRTSSSDMMRESHKVLYDVQEALPPRMDMGIPAGCHAYPFRFRIPVNNICGNPSAMVHLGGVTGVGGYATSGIRVMDGSKQLLYSHVIKTLPPSLTGFPNQAEVRYFIKVTVQRVGLFSPNVRAERDLIFTPLQPLPAENAPSRLTAATVAQFPLHITPPSTVSGSQMPHDLPVAAEESSTLPARIEMIARLVNPPALTCNKVVPLLLSAKKLAAFAGSVYLESIDINLIGHTTIRAWDASRVETMRWPLCSRANLGISLLNSTDPIDEESLLSSAPWATAVVPSTVVPSFVTCNLRRSYDLELIVGLRWSDGTRHSSNAASTSTSPPSRMWAPWLRLGQGSVSASRSAASSNTVDPTLLISLRFANVEMYSGLIPPPAFVQDVLAASRVPQPSSGGSPLSGLGSGGSSSGAGPETAQINIPNFLRPFVAAAAVAARSPPGPGSIPRLPSRSQLARPSANQQHASPNVAAASAPTSAPASASASASNTLHPDPLYPPQLGTPQAAQWQEAPPSYDEAVTTGTTPNASTTSSKQPGPAAGPR